MEQFLKEFAPSLRVTKDIDCLGVKTRRLRKMYEREDRLLAAITHWSGTQAAWSRSTLQVRVELCILPLASGRR